MDKIIFTFLCVCVFIGNTLVVAADNSSKITMFFDPQPYASSPYDRQVDQSRRYIMVPSWYVITPEGLRSTQVIDNNYINSYGIKNYEIWPMVTNGFSLEKTHEILVQKKLWPQIVESLVKEAKMHGYKGYNLDFENIDYKDKELLTEFISAISKPLQEKGIEVSLDITPLSDSKNWSLVYDRKKLAPLVNYVVLMAYDQTSKFSNKPGPNATLAWTRKSVLSLMPYVDKEKIILALPLYSRHWMTLYNDHKESYEKNCSIHRSPLEKVNHYEEASTIYDFFDPYEMTITKDTRKVSSRTFKNSDNQWLLQQPGIMVIRNEDTQEIYVSAYTKKAHHEFWLESKSLIREKIKLAKRLDIGGIAYWRKGFEDPKLWEYLDKENVSDSLYK